MKKSENQNAKSKSISLRVKPGTELRKVYDMLVLAYDTDVDLLKDALWALMEKKHPEKMDVRVIEEKVLRD